MNAVLWGEGEDIVDEDVEWGALPPPSGQADDRVGFREDNHDRPRVRRLHLISSQFVASASSSPQKTCNRFAAVPQNSESGSLFGRADVVHIGTPRQQVSRDARSWQVTNEAENDSLVNALHQNLEFSFVGNATDPIGPTTVDSLYQRANWFSPLAAEIEEEPLSAGFVTQPESFVLRPTVAESDTDSFENPNIFGESGVHENHVGMDADGPTISEVRVIAAIRLGFENSDFVDLRDTFRIRAHVMRIPLGFLKGPSRCAMRHHSFFEPECPRALRTGVPAHALVETDVLPLGFSVFAEWGNRQVCSCHPTASQTYSSGLH